MTCRYPPVERRTELSRDEFYRRYVGREPVVVEGAIGECPAVNRWTIRYLTDAAGDASVKVKLDSAGAPDDVRTMRLSEYATMLGDHEQRRSAGELPDDQPPPYLHDTPLLTRRAELLDDLIGFPADLLPRWYRNSWWLFALFFVGSANSLTPLHFDSLETNNLFFQVSGRKRFIIVPPKNREYCYRRVWRWSEVDAESPDLDRFPLFRNAEARECTLGPGDAVYIPPAAFHQVRGLESSVSFNLDWHTRSSALSGVAALARGMPFGCVVYNGIHALGLCTGLPARILYPLCRPHLETVA